jgi:hypothetical protein
MVQLLLPGAELPPERPRQLRLPLVELPATVDRKKPPPLVSSAPRRPPTREEREQLERDIERQEWAADGGDGSICSVRERDDVRCLNLEWMLNGAVIEDIAAIELRIGEAVWPAVQVPPVVAE